MMKKKDKFVMKKLKNIMKIKFNFKNLQVLKF